MYFYNLNIASTFMLALSVFIVLMALRFVINMPTADELANFYNKNYGRSSRKIECNLGLCEEEKVTMHRSVNRNDSTIK